MGLPPDPRRQGWADRKKRPWSFFFWLTRAHLWWMGFPRSNSQQGILPNCSEKVQREDEKEEASAVVDGGSIRIMPHVTNQCWLPLDGWKRHDNGTAPTLQPWPSPLWLLPVSTHERRPQRDQIPVNKGDEKSIGKFLERTAEERI